MMVRLLHLADLHLDSPFRGLSRSQPALATLLRDASLTALDRAVALALRLRAAGGLDAVTFGGDIFDLGTPSLRARGRFADALAALTAAGVPVFIVAGNHDPFDDGDSWPRVPLPPGVTLFPAGWAAVPLCQDGRVVAELVGRSYARADLDGEPLAGLPSTSAPLRIGLLHTDLDQPSDERAYSPVALDALRATGYDAWLLGHLHAPAVRCTEPLVAYAGTPQGRDLGPGEVGPRGALLVELDPGRPPVATPIPLAPVRFAHVTVEITGCLTDVELRDRLLAELATLVEAPAHPLAEPPDGALARVTIVGEAATAALWRQVTDPAERDAVIEALTLPTTPFVVLESLDAAVTGPLPSPAELRERADLLGDLARLVATAEIAGPAADAVGRAVASFGEKGLSRDFGGPTAVDLQLPAIVAEAERWIAGELADLLAEEDA